MRALKLKRRPPLTTLAQRLRVRPIPVPEVVYMLELDGFEADDIIGTLVRRADQEGDFSSFMVTPDKDFAQLVTPTIAMWKPGRKGSDHEVMDLPAIL
jgi:5'-3' exonuclease